MQKINNILITGANGQLGTELKNKLRNSEFNCFFTDIDELDISDNQKVSSFLRNNKINIIINCAAYTSVDLAEENINDAFKINSYAPSILAEYSEKLDIILIHISTDYVFAGVAHKPYNENDETGPSGIYGMSKLKGELNIIKNCSKHIIIRTSWLYSATGKNFLKTMLRLAKEKEYINVVSDQIGSPTNAGDLADAIFQIINSLMFKIEEKYFGIFNFSNLGICSWYDFARQIVKVSGENCNVKAISTNEYPTLAKRPYYSVLSKKKICKTFNLEIPHWIDSLENFYEKNYI